MQQSIKHSFFKAIICVLSISLITYILLNTNNITFAVGSGIEVTAPDITQVGQGETTYVTYQVTNNGSLPVDITDAMLEYNPWIGIDVESSSNQNATIAPSNAVDFFYTVKVNQDAKEGTKFATFTLENNGTVLYEMQKGRLIVQGNENSNNGNILSNLEISIKPSIIPEEGWEKGKDNKINFEITNTSEYKVKDVTAEIVLPAGFGVTSGSNNKSIGYFDKGRRKNITFPIIVLDDASTSFLSLDLILKGQDDKGNSFTIKKNFYIPSTTNSKLQIDDIIIKNIETPKEVESNKNFNLSFEVTNAGKEKISNLKIEAEMPEGLINKSQSTFADSFAPSQTKKYNVTVSATDPATKSYGIKITASAGDKSVSQYGSVYVGGNGQGKVKTPQLMIADYSYGGTYVQTNSSFRLNLKFLNTSAKNIHNVKVKFTADEGTFIPVNASNSIYIDSIKSKDVKDYSIMMRTKPDALQKTTGLDVEMTYEDGNGNEFTTKDKVSIAVNQEARLQIDEIMQPVDLTPGNPAGVSVQFYNMGKSVLNNLRVTAYGDFDTMESVNYFVGNMESGKSDTYDFTIVPKQKGVLEGAVVFTYEDGKGEEQSFEKPFAFNVGDAMPEIGVPVEPEEKKFNYKIPAICVAIFLAILIAGIKIFKSRLLKKRLSIEE